MPTSRKAKLTGSVFSTVTRGDVLLARGRYGEILAHYYPMNLEQEWEFVEDGESFVVIESLEKDASWHRILSVRNDGSVIVLTMPNFRDFVIFR